MADAISHDQLSSAKLTILEGNIDVSALPCFEANVEAALARDKLPRLPLVTPSDDPGSLLGVTASEGACGGANAPHDISSSMGSLQPDVDVRFLPGDAGCVGLPQSHSDARRLEGSAPHAARTPDPCLRQEGEWLRCAAGDVDESAGVTLDLAQGKDTSLGGADDYFGNHASKFTAPSGPAALSDGLIGGFCDERLDDGFWSHDLLRENADSSAQSVTEGPARAARNAPNGRRTPTSISFPAQQSRESEVRDTAWTSAPPHRLRRDVELGTLPVCARRRSEDVRNPHFETGQESSRSELRELGSLGRTSTTDSSSSLVRPVSFGLAGVDRGRDTASAAGHAPSSSFSVAITAPLGVRCHARDDSSKANIAQRTTSRPQGTPLLPNSCGVVQPRLQPSFLATGLCGVEPPPFIPAAMDSAGLVGVAVTPDLFPFEMELEVPTPETWTVPPAPPKHKSRHRGGTTAASGFSGLESTGRKASWAKSNLNVAYPEPPFLGSGGLGAQVPSCMDDMGVGGGSARSARPTSVKEQFQRSQDDLRGSPAVVRIHSSDSNRTFGACGTGVGASRSVDGYRSGTDSNGRHVPRARSATDNALPHDRRVT